MLVTDVKMEISALVQSLKSSILSSTSFQIDKAFRGVGSAAIKQSRRKGSMVAKSLETKKYTYGTHSDHSLITHVKIIEGKHLELNQFSSRKKNTFEGRLIAVSLASWDYLTHSRPDEIIDWGNAR